MVKKYHIEKTVKQEEHLFIEVKPKQPQKTIDDFIPKDTKYWTKYNKAKTQEKSMFYVLLDELCGIVSEPFHDKGRKPFPLRDLLFCACLKLYNGFSARRISSDMKHAEEAGYISKVPHFNTLLGFLNNDFTYDLLQRLITISAMPLKVLETDFAVDSTGFGACQYEKWMRVRFQKAINGKSSKRGWRNFLKAHVCIGTATHVITASEITEGNRGDSPQLPYLVKQTSKNFKPLRYSADKAYSSRKNFQLIHSLEALPFIPFKSNAQGTSKGCPIWSAMFTYFQMYREQFLSKYHHRSQVESCFSIVKRKYGEFLKCKNFTAQRNEVLLKFLVHNIACLVEQIFQNNVDIQFRKCASKYSAF